MTTQQEAREALEVLRGLIDTPSAARFNASRTLLAYIEQHAGETATDGGPNPLYDPTQDQPPASTPGPTAMPEDEARKVDEAVRAGITEGGSDDWEPAAVPVPDEAVERALNATICEGECVGWYLEQACAVRDDNGTPLVVETDLYVQEAMRAALQAAGYFALRDERDALLAGCRDNGCEVVQAEETGAHPWVRNVRAEQAEAERDALLGGVERLREQVHVPGEWKCAKCGFGVTCSTLSAHDGSIRPNEAPQQCANGCGPLWRVTERDRRREAYEVIDQWAERAESAERELTEVRARLAEVREDLYQLHIRAYRIGEDDLHDETKAALRKIDAARAQQQGGGDER
jgi:hypothetical protein